MKQGGLCAARPKRRKYRSYVGEISAAFVEQLAATASTLERQASSLKNLVAVFHL